MRYSEVIATPMGGFVRPTAQDPTGIRGPTAYATYGKTWRRVRRGLYIPREVDPVPVLGRPVGFGVDWLPTPVATQPEQRIAEIGAQLGFGALTGWAALRIIGGRWFDGVGALSGQELPVPVALDPGRSQRPIPGAQVWRSPLRSDDVLSLGGLRVVIPERAVFDEARWPGELRRAVAVIDAALQAGFTTRDKLTAYGAERRGWRGMPVWRRALDLASERAESMPESALRLMWVLDARLPPPLVNVAVHDLSGRFMGRPDLWNATVGLVGEFDGMHHRSASQHAKDTRRTDRFRRLGLEVVTIVGPDLRDVDEVVRRLRGGYERALATPPERRLWLMPPS